MTSLKTLDDIDVEAFAISVEVTNPETPFGGVQVFGVTESPIQIVLREGSQGEPGPPGEDGEPGIPGPPGTDGESGGITFTNQGITPLVAGQSYIDVPFDVAQSDADWSFMELHVVNTADSTPLNIWPGIITIKTTAGFRLQLNGLPDSGNYFLHWAVTGASVPDIPATAYTLSGPSSGDEGSPSTNFTVMRSGGTILPTPVTVTPDDGGDGGTFTPSSVVLTTASPSATFTYTPASAGAKTISTTNDGALIDPAPLTYTSFSITDAHAYTLSGPSSGVVSVASTNFTVAISGGTTLPAPVIVTPHDGGAGGTFTPTTVTLSTGTPSGTFTYTPATVGAKTISCTNDGGLTNPANLTYTASVASLSDGDPVSVWPDSSGNGNDATMTGVSRPIFKTAIVNGMPVVRFTSAGTSGLNLTTLLGILPCTIIVVMKPVSGALYLYSLANNTNDVNPFGPTFVGGVNMYIGDPANLFAVANAAYLSAFHIYRLHCDGTHARVWAIDGTPTAPTPVANAVAGASLAKIGYGSGTPNYSDGDIAEIMFIDKDVSSMASQTGEQLDSYFAGVYGITISGGIPPGATNPPAIVAGDPSGAVIRAWWKADSL